jgi:hypothetical protein
MPASFVFSGDFLDRDEVLAWLGAVGSFLRRLRRTMEHLQALAQDHF